MKRMLINSVPVILSSMLLCLFVVHRGYCLQVGEPFPEFTVASTLTAGENAYLKAKPGAELSLKDIGHKIILIEFLNVYCHTCRQQVTVFNELYSAIQKDPVLSKSVCMLGIAVGNSSDEVAEFKKTFGAVYPIVPDQHKAVFNMTGNVHGTPQSYIVSGDRERFIIYYHAGAVSTPAPYIRSLQSALRGEITGIEVGNKTPSYSFSYRGRTYSQDDFAGKKVLIYFPAGKKYEIVSDTRRPENQLKVLAEAALEAKDVQFIIFPSPAFPRELRETMNYGNVYFPEKVDDRVLQSFSISDDPAIYCITKYGRIFWGGQCLTLLNAQELYRGKAAAAVPEISAEEIIRLIEKNIREAGEQIVSTEKVSLENGIELYVTMLAPRTRGEYLFSRVESRLSVCDVCHDSHFIYTFDQQGIIRFFIPIAITKYGNVPWTADDIQKMRSVVAGKSIFMPFTFDPKVDAVTTATMSSSLIFEALREAKGSFANFKSYQFRKGHWEEICFRNMCTLKNAMEKMKKAGLNPVTGGTEIDFEHVKQYLPGGVVPACPLGGSYLPMEDSILCSTHGLNIKGCGK